MILQVREFLSSGIRSGVRGRSIQVTFVLGLVMIAFAYLSANFSPRQPHTIALDVGFSVVRFTLVLLALFWVQELLTREIDRKVILHSLALPVSRASYLIGRYLSVVTLVCISTGVLGLCLRVAVHISGPNYVQGFPVGLGLPYWTTLLGIVIDVAVVAAFSSAIAIVSTVPVMPLAMGAAFAVAGKALGASVDYITRGADGDVAFAATQGQYLDVVRWLIPDLSRLDWRDWALYGAVPTNESLAWAVLMAASYVVVAVGLAVYFLQKREFS